MKKQYEAPSFTRVLLNTQDIMSLSQLIAEDIELERDTFSWEW